MSDRRKRRIVLFGHFGQGNLGNESTLRAVLYNVSRCDPCAEFTCICTNPGLVTATYGIRAVMSRSTLTKSVKSPSLLVKLLKKYFGGAMREVYRWLHGFKVLWNSDAFIIPGTGLLTDAYTLVYWGPYDMFRWSITAWLCGCKVLFVSVGAGPIYSKAGKFFVKTALSLAAFRSYRDESTARYLESIGFQFRNDCVYPDLAFSSPEGSIQLCQNLKTRRVVGIGLMEPTGRYGVANLTAEVYRAYRDTLLKFVLWLVAQDYEVRLLIGDLADVRTTQEFKSLITERSTIHKAASVIFEPATSVESLLSQLAKTDFVVATRFHNVLFALLLNKPSIAISFHHKCSSLMSQMGLSEYCQDIRQLSADDLIRQFCQMEKNAESLKRTIEEKVAECRAALDKQYQTIFKLINSPVS